MARLDVCNDLRLLHTAGLSITLRLYPCGHELSPQMLADMDRWIIEQITSPGAAEWRNRIASGRARRNCRSGRALTPGRLFGYILPDFSRYFSVTARTCRRRWAVRPRTSWPCQTSSMPRETPEATDAEQARPTLLQRLKSLASPRRWLTGLLASRVRMVLAGGIAMAVVGMVVVGGAVRFPSPAARAAGHSGNGPGSLGPRAERRGQDDWRRRSSSRAI